MARPDTSASDAQPTLLQRLFDSPFVLLILGIVVMFLFYTGWGLLELGNLPTSTLP